MQGLELAERYPIAVLSLSVKLFVLDDVMSEAVVWGGVGEPCAPGTGETLRGGVRGVLMLAGSSATVAVDDRSGLTFLG